jgi:hypothetical protein
MPDNSFLDIIISIVLIYAILSILASIVIEWWQHYTKARARFLKSAIRELLRDERNVDFGSLFYSHYLIEGMQFRRKRRPPAYISSNMFAETLIDIIAGMHKNSRPVKLREPIDDAGKQYDLGNIIELDIIGQFDEGLKALHPSPLSETIRSYRQMSKTPEEFKNHLAHWYDDYMDRVSGWFKTDQRKTFLVIGFLVAILLNADSLHILKMVSLDSGLRNKLVTYADGVADQYQALSDSSRQDANQLRLLLTAPSDTVESGNYTGSVRTDQIKKNILFNDSISQVALQRADSVLGVVAALNIPVGWSSDSAPMSWFKKDKKDTAKEKGDKKEGKKIASSKKEKVKKEKKMKEDKQIAPSPPGVLAYVTQRNEGSIPGAIMYLIGIAITGFMLSFGAPFWFETLVKVINIRRAGVKPEASNVTK